MADKKYNVILTAQDQTRAAFDSARRSVQGLNSVLGTLGIGLSVAGFAAFIKGSIDAADQLNDLAQKTGTSVETLAGLKFAADQNGTSLESVALAAKKLSTSMADKPEIFARFGVTAKDSSGAMMELADVFANMPDGVNKTALAVKLMGRNGEEMIPFMNQGSAALREWIEQGKRFNPITTEMARQADQFKDDMAKLSAQFSGLGIAIAKDSLQPLTKIAAAMAAAAREGGLLNAVMVGLASTWNAMFTDDMLSRQQEIMKQLGELRVASEGKNISVHGRNAINDRMIALQIELESLRATSAPAPPAKDSVRGRALLSGLGVGDGKPPKPAEDADAMVKAYEKNREEGYKQIQRWNDLADPAEKYRQEIRNIQISMSEMGGVSQQVGEANIAMLQKQIDETNKVATEMDQTWQRFTENVQRNLGDVLYDNLNGKFTDIADLFKQMLLRMAADAAAANITQSLLGGFSGFAGLSTALGFNGGMVDPVTGLTDAGAVAYGGSYAGGGFTGYGSP